MRAPIDRVEGGEWSIGREGSLGQKSLAFQRRVQEDGPSREDEECPDRVRVCYPGRQRTSVSTRRAWAGNGEVKEGQG